MSKKQFERPLAQNRKASHDYFIEETYEAGIVLQGTEIKSIRGRKVSLNDAHVRIINGEAQLINMHIAPYEQGNRYNHDPTRTRKLLLHRSQIDNLVGLTQRQGYTIVPLKLYIKNSNAILLISLGHSKKQYNKQQNLKKKKIKNDIDRAIKHNYR